MSMKILFIPLLLLFIASSLLVTITYNAPDIDYDGDKSIRFPTNLNEVKSIAHLLRAHYEQNWNYILLLFSSAYLYKQAFMIPGSVLLNILAGAIFGVKLALPLCCLLASVGASCSYILSKYFGREVVEKYWSSKLESMRKKIAERDRNLFFYLLFLRLFPMSPNWLINLMCPLVGIPLPVFFLTALLGLIPYNYICIQAGEMLSSINSLNDVITYRGFLQLTMMAFASLGPTLYLKNRGIR